MPPCLLSSAWAFVCDGPLATRTSQNAVHPKFAEFTLQHHLILIYSAASILVRFAQRFEHLSDIFAPRYAHQAVFGRSTRVSDAVGQILRGSPYLHLRMFCIVPVLCVRVSYVQVGGFGDVHKNSMPIGV